ncbi:hypothetical protein [Thalassolituus sp. UBA3500]|uniref:hypothetical protein n=1 Tax=Thalassolituus sp. UBA3500 TaxID=1947664 RepID=UPI000C11CA7E|nr:hypothetical protein [Thalassolituus sp. UBA3500]MBN58758.1 hypothetical protein [Oceanospirillaceae bacterium]
MCGDGGGGSNKPEMTEAEKESAAVAVEQYDIARDLDFVKEAYESQVDALGSSGYRNYARGKANTAGMSSLEDAAKTTRVRQQQKGIDPSSGASTSEFNELTETGAEVVGRGMGEAEFSMDSAYLGGRANRVAMATGEATKAQIGLSDIADRATEEANQKAFSDFNSSKATASGLGTAAGLGASYYLNKPEAEG